MTSNLGRVYAIAVAIVVFFLAWAVVAARPWVTPGDTRADPRIAALNARERRLHADAVRVRAIVDKRWALYRSALAERKQQIAVRRKAEQALAARQAQVASQTYSAPAASAPAVSAPAAPVIRVVPATPPATQTRAS